jgi:hypothetical protein
VVALPCSRRLIDAGDDNARARHAIMHNRTHTSRRSNVDARAIVNTPNTTSITTLKGHPASTTSATGNAPNAAVAREVLG